MNAMWMVGIIFATANVSFASELDEALTQALRAFGNKNYSEAKVLLEQYSAIHTQQAPMLYFYIGECYYQINDLCQSSLEMSPC